MCRFNCRPARYMVCPRARYSPRSSVINATLSGIYQWSVNSIESPFGAMIGEINVTCPATADDIAICALYKHGLNEMLQIAYDYSKKWFFEFSPEKCIVMVWGRDRDPDVNVYMGNEMRSLVNECKHMGIKLANEQSLRKKALHERIGAGRNALLSARGLGSPRQPVPPTIFKVILVNISAQDDIWIWGCANKWLYDRRTWQGT